MERSEASVGQVVAGAGGVMLILVMFLPWFGTDQFVEVPGAGTITAEGGSRDAWHSFAVFDVLLFALAAFAIVFAVVGTRGWSLWVTAAGALAVGVVFLRLVDPPSLEDALGAMVETSVGRRIGIFFGLIAAAAVAAGGYLALTDESRRGTG